MERGGLLYSANQQTFLVYLLWVDIELGCEGAAEGLEERYCCGVEVNQQTCYQNPESEWVLEGVGLKSRKYQERATFTLSFNK